MTILAKSPSPQPRLFTVEEYLRMVDCGILTEQDKVELLEGRIISKTPRNAPHDSALQRTQGVLVRGLLGEWLLRVQCAIRLRDSVLDPDLAVVRGPVSRYDQVHPQADDALLIVEISDSTLKFDREEKSRAYAHSLIPQYWVVNLVNRRVEVFTDPTGEDDAPMYRVRRDYPEGTVLELQVPDCGNIKVNVGDLLPILAS